MDLTQTFVSYVTQSPIQFVVSVILVIVVVVGIEWFLSDETTDP